MSKAKQLLGLMGESDQGYITFEADSNVGDEALKEAEDAFTSMLVDGIKLEPEAIQVDDNIDTIQISYPADHLDRSKFNASKYKHIRMEDGYNDLEIDGDVIKGKLRGEHVVFSVTKKNGKTILTVGLWGSEDEHLVINMTPTQVQNLIAKLK